MCRLRVDPYLLLLLVTVGVASLLPARGIVALGVAHATTVAIGLLFFLYGARLSAVLRWPELSTGGCVASFWRSRSCPFRCWACFLAYWSRTCCRQTCGRE